MSIYAIAAAINPARIPTTATRLTSVPAAAARSSGFEEELVLDEVDETCEVEEEIAETCQT